MPVSSEIVRVHVWVRGRVQNVGFRAFVVAQAQNLGLNGWVKNMGWDTVEAVAEGERGIVEQFVEMMRQGPRGSRVDEARIENEVPTGEISGFEVKRSL